MKIKFDPNQDFQKEAVASIADIFTGQEACRTDFTVGTRPRFDDEEQNPAIGNRLKLMEEDVLENIRRIQLRNGLAPTENLHSMDFAVEMETGTGKTYVYLRTIFELNRKYGFTKFIIVVPSIAIKEGVYKSLQITEEHFQSLYDNIPFDYFIYDSQKLGQVRNFGNSDYIQIMVINIDAFRKSFTDPEKEDKANIIHRPHDRMTGSKPIEVIQSTNPIVIIDEPQSVDTTTKSKEAIASLNPLCTLRYSATHLDRHNMMYRLDSIDAYDRKLVKQIEVAGIEVADRHNKAYIKLIRVDNKNNQHRAHIELDIVSKSGCVQRKKKTVKPGTDLAAVSGGRYMYDGYIINDIYCAEGNEYIDFTGKPDVIRLGHAIGEVDDSQFKRWQIRKTIEEHLNKELVLRPRGIKVLSLFFVDRVTNYRDYDEDGNQVKGKYAQIFEEEYAYAIQKPKYKALFAGAELETLPAEVHNGYFAIDRKKDSRGESRWKESKGDGTTQADEGAYQMIMKDKERLLSLDTKLSFIFSHSALREGWDNPNVFQICTLNETTSVMRKRQEIGRGLRICVNAKGERVWGSDVNRLTIMANESYEDFAKKLQSELEKDAGVRFGIVEPHLFANIGRHDVEGESRYLGIERSRIVYDHLRQQGYIDSRGTMQGKLKTALRDETLDLPLAVADLAAQIAMLLRKVAGQLNLKNAGDRRQVKLRNKVDLSADFKELWEQRIKHFTTFRIDFDCEQLRENCAREISQIVVEESRFEYEKALTRVDRGGVHAEHTHSSTHIDGPMDFPLPDIVTYLQNATNLTRRSIVDILIRSKNLDVFKKNPQKFIEQATACIQSQLRRCIAGGIKYEKIGDEGYFAQELFDPKELTGYLGRNILDDSKSNYGQIVDDSDAEREFAGESEKQADVKVFGRLPEWFRIDTPLGSSNPNWAVHIEHEGVEKLFFVVDSTKSGRIRDALRPTEQAKS